MKKLTTINKTNRLEIKLIHLNKSMLKKEKTHNIPFSEKVEGTMSTVTNVQ